jgi:hypothetical protein
MRAVRFRVVSVFAMTRRRRRDAANAAHSTPAALAGWRRYLAALAAQYAASPPTTPERCWTVIGTPCRARNGKAYV